MQSSTGQYSTQAGDPAHPVQHSVMTASSLGFFLRGVASPLDLGSNLSSSGTIPAALVAADATGMGGLIAQKRQAAGLNPPLPRTLVLSSADRDRHDRHDLRAYDATANNPPAVCCRAVRRQRKFRVFLRASAGKPHLPAHPNCDSPCDRHRTPDAPALPARAVHDRLAVVASPRPQLDS